MPVVRPLERALPGPEGRHSRPIRACLHLAGLAASLVWACAPTSSGNVHDAKLRELLAAYAPVPVTATSDVKDQALVRQRQALERLRGNDRSLGARALEMFLEDHPPVERFALLTVAARNDPQRTAPMLESLFGAYDARTDLALRELAIDLLSETAPARAQAVLAPVLSELRPSATRPPIDLLVRAYAEAIASLGKNNDQVLPDLAADLARAPEARYAAVTALGELGQAGGERSQRALELVLLEPTSDGHLRRKALQALEQCMPASQLCPLIEHAAAHTSDVTFQKFLADYANRLCP